MIPIPAFFHRNARLAYQELYTFNSVPATLHEFPQGDRPDEFTRLEIDFLQRVLRYFDGAIELKDGLPIPEDFLEGQYLEGFGDEQQVSLRLPILEKLFARAGKDFPDSILGIFVPDPFSVSSLLREPTPSSTTDDNDELSSTDDEWMYPESPPHLTPLGLPLHGFDDLQVHSEDEPPLNDLIETPAQADIDIPSTMNENHTTTPHFNDSPATEDLPPAALFDAIQSVIHSLPFLPSNAPTMNEDHINYGVPNGSQINGDDHMETDANDPTSITEPTNQETLPALPRIAHEQPQRSPAHQECADDLESTLSALLAICLPLTAIRFGSRATERPINNLSKFITLEVLQQLFPEYDDYDDLAKHISRVREDQHRALNRWQNFLPQLLQIRQLLGQCTKQAETLVRCHSDYTDGLRQYACLTNIDFWHAEHGHGVLHKHEAQYFYTLSRFLTDLQHYSLAKRTHQLLACRYEHASELWSLVTTILDRLEPPSYYYELDSGRHEDISAQRRETFRIISTQ